MSFHLFRINELYSNLNGTIQFIELKVGNFNGESHWAGVAISSSREAVFVKIVVALGDQAACILSERCKLSETMTSRSGLRVTVSR